MTNTESRKKLRVSAIPYNESLSCVFHEVIDPSRQKTWELSETYRLANEEMSRYPKHWHSWLEVIIPTEGCADVAIRDKHFIVHPGELLIIPPQVIHESRRSDYNKIYKGYVVHYFGDYLYQIIDIADYLTFEEGPVPIEEDWLDHLKAVTDLRRSGDPMRSLRANILMQEILLGIFVRYSRFEQQPTSSVYVSLVQNAVSVIEETACQNIRIQDVANRLHVSYAYLSRCFRKETGITMNEFRDELRMSKAAEMIRNDDLPLDHVALEVGYSEYAAFSKKFREYHGCSPSAYRKSCHK